VLGGAVDVRVCLFVHRFTLSLLWFHGRLRNSSPLRAPLKPVSCGGCGRCGG
jgi:hypothetical protein